jgi:dTDP-4-amino-4,6-dideoxygalactose transaminase
MTFIATAEAIVQTGARPVFIEIDRTTRNISVAAVERYLAERRWTSAKGPRALLPVDLYGLPSASFELRKIADDHGLKLIEDACQAHGAKVLKGQDWVRAGSQAHAAAFSFYPGKNLGGWGDGGAIATNDAEIAARVSALRDHGRVSHYAHSDLGYNARLDAIQAAVLRAKLRRLDAWNARRREIANRYRELLSDAAVELPEEPRGYESCYHLFTIRSPNRDRICDALTKADIQCGIHYPIPLHEQPACSFLGYKLGDFPVTEGLARSVMSLPMHPHLSDDEIFTISRVVRESAARS